MTIPGIETRRRRTPPLSGKSRIAATMFSTLARNEETVIVMNVITSPIPPEITSACQVTLQVKVKPKASSAELRNETIPSVITRPSATPTTDAPRL